MIIGVSIVDKHRPEGERHVGTYMFEIDYDRNSHFDFMTVYVETQEGEEELRPYLNRLLTKETMPRPVNGTASWLEES